MRTGKMCLSMVCVSAIAGLLALAGAAMAQADAMMPEEHFAKGETLYNKQWVPIEGLFKEYLASFGELDAMKQNGEPGQQKLVGLQRELAAIRSESAEIERPVRLELGKARNLQRDYNRVLEAKPPQKPTLKELPKQPRRPPDTNRNSNYGGSGTFSGGGSSQYDRYQDQVREWRRVADDIKRQNDAAQDKYDREYKTWKANQDDAKKNMPKVEAAVKDSEGKLAKIEVDIQGRQAPVIEKVKTVNEELQSVNREASVVETRIRNMTEGLRAAPEPVRARYDIIEWDGRFYPASELQQYYNQTQAEILAVHDKLKAESETKGLPFPETWRHPQQDRLDALKKLLDAVKAAEK